MTISATNNDDGQKNGEFSRHLLVVKEALSKIKFGTISLTIHDNKIVQLDVTEKTRF